VAASKVFPTKEELKEWVLSKAKDDDMILYMTYSYQKVDFGDIDPFKVTQEEIEKLPKTTVYCWRGNFVNNTI
jgi:hypothetical protein